MNLEEITKNAEDQIGGVLKNKKITSAGIGALVGYLLTKDDERKTPNSILGALVGYYLGRENEEKAISK